MQRGEQEVARAVAGEDPAGPVPAVRRGREAEDQDPRGRIAEALHRPAPVVPVAVRRPLLARDLLAPLDEPRAAAAVDDRLVERFQGGHGRIDPSSGYALDRMRRTLCIAAPLVALLLSACGAARTSRRASSRVDQAQIAEVVDKLATAGAAPRRGDDLHRDPRQAARHRAQDRRRGLRDRDGPRDQGRQRLRPAGHRRQGQRHDGHRPGPPGRRRRASPRSRSSRKGGWRASALGAS